MMDLPVVPDSYFQSISIVVHRYSKDIRRLSWKAQRLPGPRMLRAVLSRLLAGGIPSMRIKYVLAIFLLLTTPVYAQTGTTKNLTQLNTEINSQFPDQTIGAVTPYIFRQLQLDLAASSVLGQSYAGSPTMTGNWTFNPTSGNALTANITNGVSGQLFNFSRTL